MTQLFATVILRFRTAKGECWRVKIPQGGHIDYTCEHTARDAARKINEKIQKELKIGLAMWGSCRRSFVMDVV